MIKRIGATLLVATFCLVSAGCLHKDSCLISEDGVNCNFDIGDVVDGLKDKFGE